jgi:hypothetical protein
MLKVIISNMEPLSSWLTLVAVYGAFSTYSNMSSMNYLGDPTRADLTAQLDPRGTDGRGNPLGGLVFSNAFGSSGGSPDRYIQAVEWDR